MLDIRAPARFVDSEVTRTTNSILLMVSGSSDFVVWREITAARFKRAWARPR